MADAKYWRDLETPAAIVDVDRMKANLLSARDYCSNWTINHRPHVKTHKSSALAQEQLNVGAVGLTVATPKEAEVMAQVVDDILVAYPPVGDQRLSRLLSLPEHVTLSVGLDSSESMQGLGREARKRGRTVGVLIEVDVGLGRVGVGSLEETLRLAAEAYETDGISYRGILFYPGHIRVPSGSQGPMMQALANRLMRYLSALRQAGLTPEIVSGGSTPTLFRSHQIEGLTEVRAGTGIFNDRTTALLDACARTDCALSLIHI